MTTPQLLAAGAVLAVGVWLIIHAAKAKQPRRARIVEQRTQNAARTKGDPRNARTLAPTPHGEDS